MTILTVAYYREVIGRIDTEGPAGNWESANTPLARFLENSHPGKLPNTFKYLQPEGWLAGVLKGTNYIESGVRFLSNLTIIEEGSYSLDKIGLDTLHAQLKDSTKDGTFTGKYHGPAASEFSAGFDKHLSGLWDNSLMPKFSGAQVKLPVSLVPDENGGQVILPAVHMPFSHILKVPREGFLEALPAVEWLGLELSKRAGLETADHALVEMPDGMAPALVVERFDIPHVDDELRVLSRISDFCNITDLPPLDHNKYGTDVGVCFRALEKQSSNPEADKIALFKRIVLSHYLKDGDMHLKNISVLKTFDRETEEQTVRFAPTYDALTTSIFPAKLIHPGKDEEEMDHDSALGFDPEAPAFNFEDSLLNLDGDGLLTSGLQVRSYKNRSDLMIIAERNGIPWNTADAIIDHISQTVIDNAVKIARNPPEVLKSHPTCLHALRCAVTEMFHISDAPRLSDWGCNDGELIDSREYGVCKDKPKAVVGAQQAPAPKIAFNGPAVTI